MTDRSDLGRALAALRRRTTAVCEVCGERFETWARRRQPARTCSTRCRVALHRKTKRERLSAR